MIEIPMAKTPPRTKTPPRSKTPPRTKTPGTQASRSKKACSLLFSTLLFASLAAGCGPGVPEEEPAADEAPAAEAATGADAAEGVAYEPAYPADVSAEGLSDEDVAQQEAGHSHDGEEHAHGDGTHTHGEDEPHGDHDDEH